MFEALKLRPALTVYPLAAENVRITRKTRKAGDALSNIPIARHLLFETSDLDEARERVGEIFCRHKIHYAGKGRGLAFRQNLVPMARMALSYVTYGADVEIDAGEPEEWFMVHSTVQGRCAMRVGRNEVCAHTETEVVSSATLGLRMNWSADCGQMVLKVDRSALERHLARLLDDEIRRPIEFFPEVARSPASGYRRLLTFIAAEAEEEDTFFHSALGHRHLEETVMTLLLMNFPNNYSRMLTNPPGGATPRHVRAAEEFIRTNAEEAITVDEIAAAAGVAVRTLFEGFQRFRHTTPMAYLRAIRLEAVRHELLVAPPSASVTEIAVKWGVTNLGRFAESYRRRYDELPSQTLRRSHGD
jgi:AraC-like DNA-binding protein